MYPAQTSFMPIQIALVRFFEDQGLKAISSNYPYWYLETTPFKFLTGPVLPTLLTFVHKSLLPNSNLFDIFFLALILLFVFGGVGIYLLIKNLNQSKSLAILISLLYLFGPFIPLLFPFSDGLNLIAFSFLPLVLFLYLKFLKKDDLKNKLLCIISITFIILIDSLILSSLVIGMLSLVLGFEGFKKVEKRIKEGFILLIISIIITSVWYTPGYWWQILISPSFAGKPLFQVIHQLGQLLPVALAIGLAIVSDKIIKSKNIVFKFGFYWLFVYGFLTLIRFISDPDFWLDWSSYAVQIQFGLAIGLGVIMNKYLATLKKQRILKSLRVILALIILIGVWIAVFNQYVLGTMQKNIEDTVEYKIGKKLSETVEKDQKVFLSGTSVFWLNAFFNIKQVRGGNDRVSVDSNWRQAAWEIREGRDVKKSLEWLKKLNIFYLVVHTKDSFEFYHDFKYPDKFENIKELKTIYDQEGDRIYKVMIND